MKNTEDLSKKPRIYLKSTDLLKSIKILKNIEEIRQYKWILQRISSNFRHEFTNNETISPLTTQSDNAYGIGRNK